MTKSKTVDLSPKLSSLVPADQELMVPYTSGERPLGENIGGLSMYSNTFKRGYGNQVFGSDQNGIWLGAADFENAPFRVSMDGRIFIRNETGTLEISADGITMYDENGIPVGFWGYREGMF